MAEKKYIDAEQAYDYLRSVLYETATNNVWLDEEFAAVREEIADNRLKAWLDNVPAADVVARKKGEWKDCGSIWDGEDEYQVWRCSECIIPNYKKTRFCPNCGADMREE